LTDFHLKGFAKRTLDILKGYAPAHAYLHVGAVREPAKQQPDEKLLVQLIREGLDGLASYFYKPEMALIGTQTVPLRRLDPDSGREWIAAVVKALQRGNAEAFREIALRMVERTEPPIHPRDLLRLTKQMFQPELVQLPDPVLACVGEVDRLETWEEYREWWATTIDAVVEWMNQRDQPLTAVRKEIQLMCRYIREHYMEDVQVTELAKLVHMHPSYAGQMFKQEIGENLSDYVNRVRMEKASELLENTTMKIYEVSGAVGISDYRYFCKVFKSYTGFTPTQFKSKQG